MALKTTFEEAVENLIAYHDDLIPFVYFRENDTSALVDSTCSIHMYIDQQLLMGQSHYDFAAGLKRHPKIIFTNPNARVIKIDGRDILVFKLTTTQSFDKEDAQKIVFAIISALDLFS